MNIQIHYFSGTGNTAWMVRELAARLEALGDAVTATSCEAAEASAVDPARCDVLGVAFPVHASYPPAIFGEFLRELPPAAGKPLFALTTAGYWAGDAAWHAVQPLRDRGYHPFLMDNVIVGNNLHLPLLSPIPVATPRQLARNLAQARHKIERLAAWVHGQKAYVGGTGPAGRLLGITQRWIAETFEALAFRGFFADVNCTRCGWCTQHCPTHNVELTDEGIAFGDRCILCMRCYSFCPAQAIQCTGATRNTRRYRRYRGPEGKWRDIQAVPRK